MTILSGGAVYDRFGRASNPIETMKALRFPVDVLLERVPLRNRWVDALWRPVAVIPVDRPLSEPDGVWTPHRECDGEAARWRFAGGDIELHPTEAEGYYLNLSSPEPVVFVLWRPHEDSSADLAPVFPVLVTVSYNEAARFLDAGERVDPVSMAPEIAQWIAPFVAEHYRPEPRRKERRNDPFAEDPQASARRGKR